MTLSTLWYYALYITCRTTANKDVDIHGSLWHAQTSYIMRACDENSIRYMDNDI